MQISSLVTATLTFVLYHLRLTACDLRTSCRLEFWTGFFRFHWDYLILMLTINLMKKLTSLSLVQ